MKRLIVIVAGAALVVVGIVTGVAVAAGGGQTASCTPSPDVSQADAGSQITITCTVPRPAAATVTRTVTVTPDPTTAPTSTPTRTPTRTPTTAPTTPTSTATASTPTSTPPAPPTNGFPNASNTGVRAGTTLTAYTGPTTINTAGTVIDGKTISQPLVVNADNVTVRNSRVTAGGDYGILVWGRNFSLVDSEMTGQSRTANIAGYEDRGGGDIHLLRVEGYGGVDIVRMGGDGSTVKDSYFHGVCQPSTCTGAHNDTVGVLPSVRNTTVTGNTILNENSQTAAMETGDIRSGATSGVLQGNLIGGGGYTIYSGAGDGTGWRITGNQFTTRFYSRIGYWGVAYSWTTGGGNSWSGNTYADGPRAGQAVMP